MKKGNVENQVKSQIIDYRGMLYIYYTYKGETIRESTGVKSNDYRIGDNISIVQAKKDQVDKVILEYWNEFKQKPSVNWIKDQLNQPVQLKSKEILPMLVEYINNKYDNIRPQSLKDWTNLLTSIKRYETIHGTLYVSDITKKWYDKFQLFLSKEYSVTTKYGKVIQRGGLNSNTIKKRLVVFNSFLKAYDITVPKDINYINTYDTDFEILSDIEIEMLYNKDISNELQDKVRDIFVILCLTGLRYSDYEDFTPTHHIKDNCCIIKYTVKTKEKVVIPIHQTVQQIFDKYSYTPQEVKDIVGGDIIYPVDKVIVLPRVNHTVFNRIIKQILKDIAGFDMVIEHKKESYNNVEMKYDRRYNRISSHTGRHSFISMLVNMNITNIKIAEFTGHRTLSVLNKYYKKFSQNNSGIINQINIRLK
jgi:integrase